MDENRPRASIINAGLREAGHDAVTVVYDATGIAAPTADLQPDVTNIGFENSNRDIFENLFQLARAEKRPVDRTARKGAQTCARSE